MKIAATIARILVGLVFLIFGLNGFLFFIPAPPIGGDAGTFSGVMLHSHYEYLTAGAQVVAGALLLLNQYVRFALVVLAAVLANILTFHITMMPDGLAIPIIVTVLWIVAAWPHREALTRCLFQRASS